MAKKTVAVRGREGTPTKDISIPAGVARDNGIEVGDEFVVDTTTDEEGRLVVRYTRVEQSE